ncbi:uncharacterized protein LOC134530002 [Bacillus rossius redtenbacheri]|uniref:uncharacterized protein LOC134530002 n=1 Tax=Bacillus rossius redtenbacheri TaxID=93214 RepID=UPI002FDEB79E
MKASPQPEASADRHDSPGGWFTPAPPHLDSAQSAWRADRHKYRVAQLWTVDKMAPTAVFLLVLSAAHVLAQEGGAQLSQDSQDSQVSRDSQPGSPRPAQVVLGSPWPVLYVQRAGPAARTLGSTGLLDLSLDTPHTSLHKGLLVQHPLGLSAGMLPYCRALLQGYQGYQHYQPAYQHYTAYQPAF